MLKQVVLCTGLALMLPATGAAQRGNAAEFVPAVTIDDSVGTCEVQPSAVLEDYEKGFLLRFGSDPQKQRVVSAVWDTAGHFLRYSDARGDLRGPGTSNADRGPRTTIMINVVKGVALLFNDSHGRTFGSMMAPANDALVAERLGPPIRMLERLHTQCGAPAL